MDLVTALLLLSESFKGQLAEVERLHLIIVEFEPLLILGLHPLLCVY
jgi:hypothetical protein